MALNGTWVDAKWRPHARASLHPSEREHANLQHAERHGRGKYQCRHVQHARGERDSSNGNLTVNGFCNVLSTLQVAGPATLTGNATFGGFANVATTLPSRNDSQPRRQRHGGRLRQRAEHASSRRKHRTCGDGVAMPTKHDDDAERAERIDQLVNSSSVRRSGPMLRLRRWTSPNLPGITNCPPTGFAVVRASRPRSPFRFSLFTILAEPNRRV